MQAYVYLRFGHCEAQIVLESNLKYQLEDGQKEHQYEQFEILNHYLLWLLYYELLCLPNLEQLNHESSDLFSVDFT